MFCSDWNLNEFFHAFFIYEVDIHVQFADHGALKVIILNILYSVSSLYFRLVILPYLKTPHLTIKTNRIGFGPGSLIKL